MRASHLDTRGHDVVEPAPDALRAGEVDALVYDRGMVEHHVSLDVGEPIELVRGSFERHDYAIGVPEGSPLREEIIRVLPELL